MNVELKHVVLPPKDVVITMTREEAWQLMVLIGCTSIDDKKELMQNNNTKYDPINIGNIDWSSRLYRALNAKLV